MDKKPEFVEAIAPTNALAKIGINADEFVKIVSILIRAAVTESLIDGLKILKDDLTPNQIDAVLLMQMRRIREGALAASQ